MAQNLGANIPHSLYDIFGVQYTENFGRDEQPYLYNGKEFVEIHGLNEYDSYARRYYPAICRATTMDPLAECYYHISPYAWCGNNPVNNFDLDGRKWKKKRDERIAKRLSEKANINILNQLRRLKRLQSQQWKCSEEKKLEKIKEQMEDAQNQIKKLTKLKESMSLLADSENNVYTFKTNDNDDKKEVTLGKESDGAITINVFDNNGSRGHELIHAAQYERGELVYDETKNQFVPNDNNDLIELEIEAYQTEFSISGYVSAPSDAGEVNSSLEINEDWIRGVYNPETKKHPYNP